MTHDPFAPAFDIPALWDQARGLLADGLARCGDPEALAEQRHMRRRDQFAIRAWLMPVERIVRGLIAVAAATHLLMTSEGQRRSRSAQKVAPPLAPSPPPTRSPSRRPAGPPSRGAGAANQNLHQRRTGNSGPCGARSIPQCLPRPRPELSNRTPKKPLPLAFRTLLSASTPRRLCDRHAAYHQSAR